MIGGMSDSRSKTSADITPAELAKLGKARLVTLDSLDGRTTAARNVRRTMAAITSDLGGDDNLSTAQRQLIQRAAVMDAMLEAFETAWLAGEPMSHDQYLPVANAQRRTLDSLGIKRQPRDTQPDLSSYVQAKAKPAK